MNIDWSSFTPWHALAGGVLIGVATALFLWVNGRVLGISSIVGDALRSPRQDWLWRLTFVLGLLAAPGVYRLFAPLPEVQIDASWPTLVLAGLLVGVGTRYGAGCTSGHGVCGLSRRSPRSLAATLAFMVAGFVTVYLVRHVLA